MVIAKYAVASFDSAYTIILPPSHKHGLHLVPISNAAKSMEFVRFCRTYRAGSTGPGRFIGTTPTTRSISMAMMAGSAMTTVTTAITTTATDLTNFQSAAFAVELGNRQLGDSKILVEGPRSALKF